MFSVYKDQSISRLLASYSTLAEALATLQKNNALVISPGETIFGPVVISAYNVTLFGGTSGLDVWLDTIATLFRLGGDTSANVHTSESNTRVYGNDADNTFFGNIGRDFFHGGSGDDIMYGEGGDDVLYGGDGADRLYAGDGRDRVYGGDGDDRIFASEGQNRLYGNAGSDTFVLDLAGAVQHIVYDFSISDRLEITGLDGFLELADLLDAGGRIYQSKANTIIRIEDAMIQLRDFDVADLSDALVTFVPASAPEVFATFAEFLASGQDQTQDSADINGVVYNLRSEEPQHVDYKFTDTSGRWWSPDYFVLVAAGQSNMVGGATGADMTLNANVIAYDWFNDAIIPADYAGFPAVTREGAAPRNNLYFPMANQLVDAMDRPVLVIAHPVSGSRISSWLMSESGEHWTALDAEIALALGHIGQDKIDSFIWHQGESDYPISNADFAVKVETLIAQARSAEWGASDLNILLGELSRDGVNFVQNGAYQELELADTDQHLGFVSSAGLTSAEASGVHFDAQSLIAFGGRFFDGLMGLLAGDQPGPVNTAPTVNSDAAPMTAVTIQEGQEIRINVSDYFTDAEGDDLSYYSYLNKRGVYLARADQETDELVIMPNYDHAGDWTLTVYANDYLLDGGSVDIAVNVTEGTPLVETYRNSAYDRYSGSYRDFETGMETLSRNRAILILDQAALDAGDNLVNVKNAHIKGGVGITGSFVLGEGVEFSYLYGAAEFDVTGNAMDNYVVGSDAANTLSGAYGRDRLYGNGSDDILIGGADNDQLYGGDGDDLIDAGTGSDSAWGGLGADQFDFHAGDGQLQLRDFEAADVLVMSGYDGVTDFGSLMANAVLRPSDTRTIIDIGTDRIILADTAVEDVNASMFAFV